MRKLFLTTLLLTSLSTWSMSDADAVVVNETVADADVGTVYIKATDIGEPVYEPLQLQINLVCKDQRTNRNNGSLRTVAVMRPSKICAWGGHAYNPATQILTVKFASAAIVVGDAPCEMQPPVRFNIKKLCAPWRR